jgi:gluconate 5-dehydrogenase
VTLTPPNFDLAGRVALVTGATRGLGWAIAQALAGAGAKILICARGADAAEQRAAALSAAGAAADALPFDVTDAAAVDAAFAAIRARYGRLDILVNNAGITVRKPLLEHTDGDWNAVLDTDLTACFRLSREAARLMVPQRWGRIIMVSSIASQVARPTIPGYVTAKAALNGLVRALAVELAPSGVTVNAVGPGYFPTEANQIVRADTAFYDWICRRTPAGRWGDPVELGGAVVYFASPAASYCTGAILMIDGGLTASM